MTAPASGYGTSMHWPYCQDGNCTGCLPPSPPQAALEEVFGTPRDPDADEQLRADLAAVREAERAATCRHPEHLGMESCLHRHAHG